MNFKC